MQPIPFDNTFVRDLPGAGVPWQPAKAPAPQLLFLNAELAGQLGLDAAALSGDEGAALFAGNTLPEGAQPIAQAYAGHQFGGFSPRLGDGRALLLGEVIDTHGQRRDIAFKGSGRTPFARGGDGKAAVGPMLREVLIGEAMHALGIPTTRALAVVATGEEVFREAAFPGAVLTRVAASHLRVGSFQYFAARGDIDQLRALAEYTIARHDPQLLGAPDRYLGLLRAVANRQAKLIAQWMNVGFIHGVMNTDNMTISGETIDYGPCAFMESFDPATVFSSIDHGGRYAYGNQPLIARWNLARLAEALLPLMCAADDGAAVKTALAQVTAVLDEFPAVYAAALLQGQRAKLGLQPGATDAEQGAADGDEGKVAGDDLDNAERAAADTALVGDWLALLQQHQVDFTLAWRQLGHAAQGDANPLRALFAQASDVNPWLARWQARCSQEDLGDSGAPAARAARMQAVNPWLIPRNQRVEEALAAASEHADLVPFKRLLAALQQPFVEDIEFARYAQPSPRVVTARYQTFCGT